MRWIRQGTDINRNTVVAVACRAYAGAIGCFAFWKQIAKL